MLPHEQEKVFKHLVNGFGIDDHAEEFVFLEGEKTDLGAPEERELERKTFHEQIGNAVLGIVQSTFFGLHLQISFV